MEHPLYVWSLIVLISVTMYVITAGTRLGIGFWYLFADHDEREYILKALEPQIEASELWFIGAGTFFFILFPWIFHIVFRGFYPVLIVIFLLLLIRIIALSARNIMHYHLWESLWDVIISVSSLVTMFLSGLIAGYILKGIPLYSVGRFNVNLLGYISHYTIVSGLLIIMATATLSGSRLAWNSDGIIRLRARKWSYYSSVIMCILLFDLIIWSLLVSPYISANLRENKYLLIIPITVLIASLAIPYLLSKRRFKLSYFVTIIIIGGLSSFFIVSIFPHLQTIFFESQTPRVRVHIRPHVDFQAMQEYRKKLIPLYILYMAAIAGLQALIIKRKSRPVHCPLPFEEEDDSLW